MPDIKNYDKKESDKDLKKADADKSGGVSVQFSGINTPKQRKNDSDGFVKSRSAARKRLPIAVDILIAVLFVALFAGLVVGAYYAFRYFADDYESVNVGYTIIVDPKEDVDYNALNGQNLYYDVNGSLEYFGKVTGVVYTETEDRVFVSVTANAGYKEKYGYFIGDTKLAVGEKEIVLRAENGIHFSGVIVELTDNTNPQNTDTELKTVSAVMSFEGGK